MHSLKVWHAASIVELPPNKNHAHVCTLFSPLGSFFLFLSFFFSFFHIFTTLPNFPSFLSLHRIPAHVRDVVTLLQLSSPELARRAQLSLGKQCAAALPVASISFGSSKKDVFRWFMYSSFSSERSLNVYHADTCVRVSPSSSPSSMHDMSTTMPVYVHSSCNCVLAISTIRLIAMHMLRTVPLYYYVCERQHTRRP